MSEKSSDALGVLQKTFGYRNFVGRQQEVIAHILAGGDALALMPTGGGKSLCYQIPALLRPGIGVVVSPLIALMKDQVDALLQHGVRAAYLNSSLTPKQAAAVEEQFAGGKLDLLYVAPERLLTERCLGILRRGRVALFAIDEAHCVSQWGHDFRREYLKLGQLAVDFPQVPRLALTATADSRTRDEIVEKLKLRDAKNFIASFDRPNIYFSVVRRDNPRQQLLDLYRQHAQQSGIIYCMTRRKTEETAAFLEQQGVPAVPYHAGMDNSTRRRHQDKFVHQDNVVAVATIAFGMGIDKPDVRFVAHADLPKSVEGYYQEVGRAGRDGLPAAALLLYSLGDTMRIKRMIEDGDAPDRIRRVERQKLDALVTMCEAADCRRKILLNYFGEEFSAPCNNCDNCVAPPEMWDGKIAAQKFLSCVVRTRETFGAGQIIDVLLGKDTERIRKFNHQQLSTFGVGGELSAREWRSVAQQLIGGGLLAPDQEGYGSLKLTPAAWQVMGGSREVSLRREPERVKTPRGERPPRTAVADGLDQRQAAVFELLRGERKRLADKQKVPAYVIFHDSVLAEIARRRPPNIESLAQIPGVGVVKLARYGDNFLKVLQNVNDTAAPRDAKNS